MDNENVRITDDTPLSFLTVGQFKRLMSNPAKKEIPKQEIPEVFGTKLAAKISGYSVATIYSKTSKKEIPFFKRDNLVLFRKDLFFEWLTENRVETSSEYSKRMDQHLVNKKR